MSVDNPTQGTDADIASRLEGLSDEAPETVETPQSQDESEEVMPASEPDEAEQGVEEAQTEEEDIQLPEGVNDRTKQAFEKLTESNKALKAQLDAKANDPAQQYIDTPEGTSVFDSIYGKRGEQAPMPQGYEQVTNANNYQNLNQGQVNNVASQYIHEDPNTGDRTVDVEGLVNALQLENQKVVQQAESRAHQIIERYEESRQVTEAHQKHPYLDPQNKENFDSVFYDQVRLRALDNLARGGKKSLNQLAEEVLTVYTPKTGQPNVPKERQDAVAKFKQAQEIKKQARPINRGRGADRQSSAATYEALRQRSQSANRTESDQAIIERLSRAS